MSDDPLYEERVSSSRTQALFCSLTALFLVLCLWRATVTGWKILAFAFLFASLVFLFYCLNYRTLVIRVTAKSLSLRFGLVAWTIPLDNVADCRLDDLSGLLRHGGAGVHFMFIRGRYRVSFNLLEYPRVLVALKRPRIVRDVSFTTRHPDKLVSLLNMVRSTSAA